MAAGEVCARRSAHAVSVWWVCRSVNDGCAVGVGRNGGRHKAQSSVGTGTESGLSSASTHLTPLPLQTSVMPRWVNSGDAKAIPQQSRRHNKTQRWRARWGCRKLGMRGL